MDPGEQGTRNAIQSGALLVLFAAAVVSLVCLPGLRAGAQTTVTAGDVTARAGDAADGATVQVGDLTVKAGTATSPARVETEDLEVEAASQGRQEGDRTAAQETDPLKGRTANISSDDDDGIANTVEIAVADCAASGDASVVVEDEDGTRVELANGANVEMTETADGITIEGVDGAENNIEAAPIQGPADGDGELSEGRGEVISSTGFACEGGSSTGQEAEEASAAAASAGAVSLTCEQLIELVNDGAASGQYATEISQRCEGSANVISATVPGKALADTGGPLPGLLAAGLLLVTGGGLLLRSALRRR